MRVPNPMLAGHVPGDRLALRFRQSRQHAGLSVKDVSTRMNVSESMIRKIEPGQTQMIADPANIRNAALIFGVSDVWLYAGAYGAASKVPEWYVPGLMQ